MIQSHNHIRLCSRYTACDLGIAFWQTVGGVSRYDQILAFNVPEPTQARNKRRKSQVVARDAD
ncbi:hypothetical protein ACVWYJ_007546 [Bradyrhizobium sp. USDA 4471]